jgi:hypothetical protein
MNTATPTSTTISTPFPYQGSGTGNWSGQITFRNRVIPVSGTTSVAVDANGVFTGSITSSRGGSLPTTITAQVDSNGNLSGTVSFTIANMTFVTKWQGVMTKSGNSLSMQGTWTGQYGSRTFSGTGTATSS